MKHIKSFKQQQGFTLLEVLLVVAIIAILASIVIIAINPGKQTADTRNTQRRADVTTILNAVYQYSLDNSGALPAGITTSATEICKTGTLAATCTTDSLANIHEVSDNGTYVVSVPLDPQCPSACATNGVGYTIVRDTNGRITVAAPDAEQSATISVTR